MTAPTLTAPAVLEQPHDHDGDRRFLEAMQSPTYTTDRRHGEFAVGVASYEPARLEDEPW